MKQSKNSETQSYSWDVTVQPSPYLPYLALQRKQDFYENGIIFCTTPRAFLYCREPKQLPSCLCTTQPHELSVHTASTTYRKREPNSLECVRNNCLRAACRGVLHPSISKRLTLHPLYSHWSTQWGQTPPRDFPHPAELSFCRAVLPRAWYCKLQPRVSTGCQSHYWHKLLTG